MLIACFGVRGFTIFTNEVQEAACSDGVITVFTEGEVGEMFAVEVDEEEEDEFNLRGRAEEAKFEAAVETRLRERR